MKWEDVIGWLEGNAYFCDNRAAALKSNARSQFGISHNEKDAVDWQYLLECSSFLSQCPDEMAKAEALQFATGALVSRNATDETRTAAMEILSRLYNLPSQTLAIQKGLVDDEFFSSLPLGIQLNAIRRESKCYVNVDGRVVMLNEFQQRFWSLISGGKKAVSVSAPTSTGKSFLVKFWIESLLNSPKALTILYIVPTRALVQEVAADFERVIANHEYNVGVYQWFDPEEKTTSPCIYVLTQERCLQLLEGSETSIDVLIVDEAHKIEDNTRGVLLEYMIARVLSENPDIYQLYLSPTIENPEVFVDGDGSRSILSKRPVVVQNLIWVDAVPRKPKSWNVRLIDRGFQQELGTVELDQRGLDSGYRRLALVAHEMGRKASGNLVYANGASEAEKIANLLSNVGTDGMDANPAIQKARLELSELIGDLLNPKYVLAKVVLKGVGIHFGDLPLVIKQAVETAFKQGVLRYLVCTATLTEGVNLPCQNIFIRSPKRGNQRPMTEEDFWNLAGRAGRWGMEFQGNVICIDPQKDGAWGMDPPLVKKYCRIKKGSNVGVGRWESIVDSLGRTHQNSDKADAYLSSCLAGLIASEIKPEEVVGRLGLTLPLYQTAKEILDSYDVPLAVVRRNPGLSPRQIESLYQAVLKLDELEEWIPPVPEDPSAKESYYRILDLVNEHIEPSLGNAPRLRGLANTMTNWMKGLPLALIIKSKKGFSEAKVNSFVRKVLEDVEQYMRFRIPRIFQLFSDVLIAASVQRGVTLSEIPDLWPYLEFGQSNPASVTLMKLGLSRFAASEIAPQLPNVEVGVDGLRAWLLEDDRWQVLPVAESAIRELARALGQQPGTESG